MDIRRLAVTLAMALAALTSGCEVDDKPEDVLQEDASSSEPRHEEDCGCPE